jgi:hypothetical protein
MRFRSGRQICYEIIYYSHFWTKNKKRHRLIGPAMIYSSGQIHWYKNGKLHRSNEPAVIYPGGWRAWYIDGGFIKGAYEI